MSTTMNDKQARRVISENIRRLLAERGRSAYWLMKRLGVSSGAIYPIIRGESQPLLSLAARIASVMGVEIEELIQEKFDK